MNGKNAKPKITKWSGALTKGQSGYLASNFTPTGSGVQKAMPEENEVYIDGYRVEGVSHISITYDTYGYPQVNLSLVVRGITNEKNKLYLRTLYEPASGAVNLLKHARRLGPDMPEKKNTNIGGIEDETD